MVGFLTQSRRGLLHFLVRASFEPGNRDGFELGPTAACSEPRRRAGCPGSPDFLSLLLDPDPALVRYRARQSEEGGRFHHFQNDYLILEWPEDEPLDVPTDRFIWMTLRQIASLTRHGYFTIEARNLLACLDLGQPGEGDGA